MIRSLSRIYKPVKSTSKDLIESFNRFNKKLGENNIVLINGSLDLSNPKHAKFFQDNFKEVSFEEMRKNYDVLTEALKNAPYW